ncbi:hypothetical protein BDV25DRAFT_9338 [Aspergillus avenaceus]|uniref:Uncharacterized protein n=1 Tax=Aspergillus avenaceus TaxID=36643 RepID=A0A5N6U5Q3_ASPAV|nr:hypothetical protein BDV25DRAFT_9338 [Aspergillus avenaceus]
MPGNSRLPVSAPQLRSFLIPRPPRPCLLPLQSVWQPTEFHTPKSVQTRLYGILTQDWEGTSPEDHVVERRRKRDTTDPTVSGADAGMQEREEAEGVADSSKQQGATEREGAKHGKQAKREHPKAPAPIIGMNDERGHKGH